MSHFTCLEFTRESLVGLLVLYFVKGIRVFQKRTQKGQWDRAEGWSHCEKTKDRGISLEWIRS